MTILRTALPVSRLGCGGGGSLTVERVLRRARGVRNAYVNPATEMAYVEYDPAVTGLDELAAALRRSGFEAPDRHAVRGSWPRRPGSPGPTEGGGS